LRPRFVPEKVGVNKKGVNKKDITFRNNARSRDCRNREQPAKSIKLKMKDVN
jgi:hypothetical protein